MTWNHNTHYHDVVLRAVPDHCKRALDVGCGEGLLAYQLAKRCGEVVAIDIDEGALARAVAKYGDEGRIAFRHCDVMRGDLAAESFDFISAVAALHHLPLKPALDRFQALLRPGGVLAIVGLYRARTPMDYATASVAFPASWAMRLVRGHAEVSAPVAEPKDTLEDIRVAFNDLAGAKVQRRLFFRYTLVWRKP